MIVERGIEKTGPLEALTVIWEFCANIAQKKPVPTATGFSTYIETLNHLFCSEIYYFQRYFAIAFILRARS